MKRHGRPARHRIGSKRRRPWKRDKEPRQWFSLEVAAKHAATQQGVDIRQRLYDSYSHPTPE